MLTRFIENTISSMQISMVRETGIRRLREIILFQAPASTDTATTPAD